MTPSQSDEEMSHWDEAMAELGASFGCSPGGALLGTSPIDNVLDMFGGVMKHESDESMNEGRQEGEARGGGGKQQQRGGSASRRGKSRNGGSGGGAVPPPHCHDDEETSDGQAKEGVAEGDMDLDGELAEMADTLLLLHEGGP